MRMGTDKVMTIDDGMKRRGRRVAWLVALGSTTLLNAAVTKSYGAELFQGAQAVRSFSIPAQSLDDGLARFGQQSGWQVSVDGNLAKSLTTHGVSGTMTSARALDAILSGTGLTYTITGGRTVVLTKAAASIILGPVRVGGTITQQDPTGPGVGYVAENTMVGTKTDTPITEIPNSVYVVTKQLMTDQQPQNILQALRYTPGIYSEAGGTTNRGSAQNDSVDIYQRGFASSQFVDGLMTNSYAATEPTFLERIEALNGPASVMYGQTTPGGMVGMSLKKPTDAPLHQVSVGFGSWGRYEATFDVSDKITQSGNLRYRVAAIGVTSGTQEDRVDYHRVGVLPSITWDIDPKTHFTLLGTYMYTPGGGGNTAYPILGTLIHNSEIPRISRSTFIGIPNWNTKGDKVGMFEYQFDHKFNKFVEFNQTFRFEDSLENFSDITDVEPITANGKEIYFYPWKQSYRNRTAALDTRVSGRVFTGPVRHTWVVGSDFRNYDYNYTNLVDEGATLIVPAQHPTSNYSPCVSLTSSNCYVWAGINPDYNSFQEGIYFQDQIKWRRLSVLLGGRQDWVNSSNKYHSISNVYGTLKYGVNNTAPLPQSAFTWRAGIIYNFDFGLTPYFSYATSFVPQQAANWQGKVFAPLSGKQLEAGLKYKVPDKDILITASAFRIDEDHYLISDLIHTGYSSDAGTVRSQGFEVSANTNITKNLKLVASYTYEDVRFRKNNLTNRTADPTTLTYGPEVGEDGKFVPYVPRNMFNIFADYTFHDTPLKGFGINGGVRYTGFTYSDYVESYKVPAYYLFDIGAHYDFGDMTPALKGLRAQLAISNLTNKYYVTACAIAQCYLGYARKFYGNITYNW